MATLCIENLLQNTVICLRDSDTGEIVVNRFIRESGSVHFDVELNSNLIITVRRHGYCNARLYVQINETVSTIHIGSAQEDPIFENGGIPQNPITNYRQAQQTIDEISPPPSIPLPLRRRRKIE